MNMYINTHETSGAIQTSAGLATVKRAFASGNTVATHQIVAAVSGKKIRVLGFFVTAEEAVNITFKSGSTTISANIAAAGAVVAYCPHGWFETAVGAALGFAIDAAKATSVQVVYVETE